VLSELRNLRLLTAEEAVVEIPLNAIEGDRHGGLLRKE
jgi:hypothetical protein